MTIEQYHQPDALSHDPDLSARLAIELLDNDQQDQIAARVEDFVDWALDDNQRSANAFAAYVMVDRGIKAIAGADGTIITPELSEAYRLYTGSLFERISALERAGDETQARRVASAAKKTLMSGSPNIASYSGGPVEQFRLVTLAQATPLARKLAAPMIDDLTYTVAYHYEDDVLEPALHSGDEITQLQAMNVLKDIAYSGMDDDWTDPAVRKAVYALEAGAEDEGNSLLVRKVAYANADEIRREVSAAWGDFSELPEEEQQELWANHSLWEQQTKAKEEEYTAQQDRLHEQFPGLAPDAPAVRLANDCAATTDHWGTSFTVVKRVRSDGSSAVGLLDVVRGNQTLGLNAEQSLLLQELHRPHVRQLVEDDLGIDLADITLDSQLHLLDYLSSSDAVVYGRLTSVMHKADPTERQAYAEAFLSLEFGSDYADIIMDLAESTEPHELTPILQDIADIRRHAATMGEAFTSDNQLDATVAQAVPMAWAKRTTELLALARRDGIKSVSGSLKALKNVAGEISGALHDDVFEQVEATAEYTTLRAQNHKLTITARPLGDNARLGFTVRGLGEDGRQRVSVRLDYEAGQLSLDIGSTSGSVNSSDTSRRIGTDLAKGELALASMRAERSIGSVATDQVIILHGNHVREAFSHLPHLEPEQFSGIVHRFTDRLPRPGQQASPDATKPRTAA